MGRKPSLASGKHVQVALDFIALEKALVVAINSIKAGVTIVEAGTPLVKAEGIKGLKVLRAISPDILLLADTKTADAGDVEAEIASQGGANIMTVLGAMDDSTISSAVKRANESGILVQVDMINVKDPVKRAREVSKLGVDIIGFHVGLDVQKTRNISVSSLREEIVEVSSLEIPISVAGGLNPERITELADLPISIFVVGSYITSSSNPYDTALRCVKALHP
ncbi:3-hexulose-6-phosphate synthase [Sulfolobales archaeon HS-7]|nr:3-hexulose-6-phosphate synthase [Sulfolobales archaeon HS-7]